MRKCLAHEGSRLKAPPPPKSCRFRSCDVYADEAFLVIGASSTRRACDLEGAGAGQLSEFNDLHSDKKSKGLSSLLFFYQSLFPLKYRLSFLNKGLDSFFVILCLPHFMLAKLFELKHFQQERAVFISKNFLCLNHCFCRSVQPLT